MKLDLPEGISLVDKNLDANNLQLNTEIELLITIPEGKVIDYLKIHGEDKKGKIVDNKLKVLVTNDLTISVAFRDIVKYTISLDLYEGTGVDNLKVTEGETPVIPSPQKDGFVFDKWVLPDGTDYELALITSDMTLKAIYLKAYKVTLVEGVTVE